MCGAQSRSGFRGERETFFKGVGYAVAQLVEALCYKPEGRVFLSRWGFEILY